MAGQWICRPATIRSDGVGELSQVDKMLVGSALYDHGRSLQKQSPERGVFTRVEQQAHDLFFWMVTAPFRHAPYGSAMYPTPFVHHPDHHN